LIFALFIISYESSNLVKTQSLTKNFVLYYINYLDIPISKNRLISIFDLLLI